MHYLLQFYPQEKKPTGHEEGMLVMEISGPSKGIPQGVLVEEEGKLWAMQILHKKARSANTSLPAISV